MLSFTNPGEIDLRVITLMGVNVKPNSANPIGYFGTGLKYAMAVALRNGCSVVLWRGTQRVDFTLQSESIRGQTIQTVLMSPDGEAPIRLPFTLDLGKNWELWMAYREFYCNAIDEGGTTADGAAVPTPDTTTFHIEGLDSTHRQRAEFLLLSQPVITHPVANVHLGQSSAMFYRGIKVVALPHPSLFTYNLKEPQRLTEDRTLPALYTASQSAAVALLSSDAKALIQRAITAPPDTFEHSVEFDNWRAADKVSEAAKACLIETYTHRKSTLTPTALKLAKSLCPAPELPTPAKLTKVQQQILAKAVAFLHDMGYTIEHPIHVTDHLEGQFLGQAHNGTILLSRTVFEQGTKRVAGTILEEHLHLTKNFSDLTYEFQNYLIDKIVTLGEELSGQPL